MQQIRFLTLTCAYILTKKALGSNERTNKCQHPGENEAISKWRECFRRSQGGPGKSGAALGSAHQAKSEYKAKGAKQLVCPRTSTEPSVAGAEQGVRGAGGRPGGLQAPPATWALTPRERAEK